MQKKDESHNYGFEPLHLAAKVESHSNGFGHHPSPLPLKPGHNLSPISEEGKVMWELLISSQILKV